MDSDPFLLRRDIVIITLIRITLREMGIMSQPELRLEAGVRHERTLEAVSSRPFSGGIPVRILARHYCRCVMTVALDTRGEPAPASAAFFATQSLAF